MREAIAGAREVALRVVMAISGSNDAAALMGTDGVARAMSGRRDLR
jgi:hypothetical protein